MPQTMRSSAKPYEVRVFLQDELPRLGAGLRTLTIKKGRKWVRISDCMGRAVRLSYDRIERTLPFIAEHL